MANPNISNYVRQEIQKGTSREKIRKELIEAGWSAQDVSDAVAPYPDQNFSDSSDSQTKAVKGAGPEFSSKSGSGALISEKNSALATFNIENISDTKDSSINPVKSAEGAPAAGKRGFRMANIGAFFLFIIIAGAIFFVIRQISGALNTGGINQLATSTSGETVIQKVRNQNQNLAGQAGAGSSTPILYPSGSAPGSIPQTAGQGTAGGPIPFTPNQTTTPAAAGTPVASPPLTTGQGSAPITGTPVGSEGGAPGEAAGATPGTPFTPPPQGAPTGQPSPVGTPFVPVSPPVSQNTSSPASQSSGNVSPPTITTAPSTVSGQNHTTTVPLPIPVFPSTQFVPTDALRLVLVQVLNITSVSADIAWTSNHLAFFKFEYGTSTSYGSFYPVNSIPVTFATIKIQNLSPLTQYHYRLKLADGSGSSVFSPDAAFITERAPTSTAPASNIPANSSTAQSIGDQLNAIKARLLFLLESIKG